MVVLWRVVLEGGVISGLVQEDIQGLGVMWIMANSLVYNVGDGKIGTLGQRLSISRRKGMHSFCGANA